MKKYLIFFFLIFFTNVLKAQSNPDLNNKTGSAPFSQAKFVPDLSLILDFSGVGSNRKDDKSASQEIPGLIKSKPEINSQEGFNFNYAELSASSIVDPYLDLMGIFHISEEKMEIEEAYFNTRALPWGFKLKGGKFKSHFGRINEVHHHFWDFADAPLIYRAFFGDEGLKDKGIRLTWVAPLPVFLMLGGEVMQGENEISFGKEGFTDASGSRTIDSARYPNTYTGNARISFDIGELTVLAGASYAGGKTRLNKGVDDPSNSAGYAEYSTTDITGTDLTLKYSLDSRRFISLQGEYLFRKMDGSRYDNAGSKAGISKKQSGLYTQLILKFAQRWRLGLRYDLIHKNEIIIGEFKEDLPTKLPRYTGMMDFNPSEFSRIRLQYNYDQSGFEGESLERQLNHQVILQFNMAIGAHGAHSF
jgi:hypothetical protein